MIYQEYFKQSDFEEIWKFLHSFYKEDSRLKPHYNLLIEEIKKIKVKKKYSKDEILLYIGKNVSIEGIPDPQEWLVGRKVHIEGKTSSLFSMAEISAHLIFWSTLYSFKTRSQYEQDFVRYYEDIENNIIRPLKYQETFITESLAKKKLNFWKYQINIDSAISWETNLQILKRKLEYNIGYWRLVQRHIGWKEDVNRMKVCCNLLEIATRDSEISDENAIYVNSNNASRYRIKLEKGGLKQFSLEKLRQEKAFRIVWKYIDHNMKEWWD